MLRTHPYDLMIKLELNLMKYHGWCTLVRSEGPNVLSEDPKDPKGGALAPTQ